MFINRDGDSSMANITEDAFNKELTVHTYAKGAPVEERPVTVKAPIITDGTTEEGVQPLLDFVKSIEAHSNTEVAVEEAKRLQPYFSALSVYLTRALKEADPESPTARDRKELKGLIAPGELSDMFNAMADYTCVTLTSDVVIMPGKIREGPAAHLFPETYNPIFRYGDHPFSFGFLKLFEGGHEATARSGTTVPIFMLDTRLMEEIAPHQPAKLYRHLQVVVTDMNHDMLHHLHSLAIGDQVAHKFKGHNRYYNPVTTWATALPASSWAGGIEEWSQISHGKVFMTPGNEALIKEVGANLDRYFDELARISKALSKDKAHEVVDYFGTVMAQTLSRTFPFNHPLMTQCLDRMQTADPFSEPELLKAAVKQYVKITELPSLKAVMKQYAKMIWPPSASLKAVRKSMIDTTTDIIEGYRQQGFEILPDDDNAVNFKCLKLLQLTVLEPAETRSHVPTPVGKKEKKVRANSDRAFLDLLRIAATTTGYRLE